MMVCNIDIPLMIIYVLSETVFYGHAYRMSSNTRNKPRNTLSVEIRNSYIR